MRVFGCQVIYDDDKKSKFHLNFDTFDIGDDLKSHQMFVGGYIENVCLANGVARGRQFSIDMICNEDGKILHLPPTISLSYSDNVFDMICGSFFICIGDDETGEYVSLNDKLIKIIKSYFEFPSFCCAVGEQLLINIDLNDLQNEVTEYAKNEK